MSASGYVDGKDCGFFFCVLISALFREEEGCDFWVDFGFEGG
jgi:hypothetical protein